MCCFRFVSLRMIKYVHCGMMTTSETHGLDSGRRWLEIEAASGPESLIVARS
jgi:hypothetical protein